MAIDEMYDMLVDCGVAEDFVKGAVCVGGWNEETMERVLFYSFGVRSFDDLFSEEEED